MIPNIIKGKGWRGLANYLLRDAARPEIVGGNMSGITARELAAEIAPVRQLKETDGRVKKYVYHVSLSLPKGEHLSPDKWDVIGREFIRRMGADPETHPYYMVRHNDTPHEHVHIALSRIDINGNIWSPPKRDFDLAQKICADLEKDFGLQIVERKNKAEKRNNPKPASTRERRKLARTSGKPMEELMNRREKAIAAIRSAVDEALEKKPRNLADFERLLAERRVFVRRHERAGQIVGLSFCAREISQDYYAGSTAGWPWGRVRHRLLRAQELHLRPAAPTPRLRPAAPTPRAEAEADAWTPRPTPTPAEAEAESTRPRPRTAAEWAEALGTPPWLLRVIARGDCAELHLATGGIVAIDPVSVSWPQQDTEFCTHAAEAMVLAAAASGWTRIHIEANDPEQRRLLAEAARRHGLRIAGDPAIIPEERDHARHHRPKDPQPLDAASAPGDGAGAGADQNPDGRMDGGDHDDHLPGRTGVGDPRHIHHDVAPAPEEPEAEEEDHYDLTL